MIPLEDNAADVVAKAMRGLLQTDAMVAERSGVDVSTVVAIRTGTWDEAAGRRIAQALQLDPDALSALASAAVHPPPLELPGLMCFSTPFDDMWVNSYLVWDSAAKTACAFDTGADAGPILDFLRAENLSLQAVFITHTHGDHVFELDRLCEQTGAQPFVNQREPLDGAHCFDANASWTVGSLSVESRLTSGHSKGGTTYVVRGLQKTVAVVGDALFASSMGGAKVSYAEALATNQSAIFTLPADTILCPGHGPLTTVGWEKRHNPFFAGRV